MKSKAQTANPRGSVVNYVTKRFADWNAAIHACRFWLSQGHVAIVIFSEVFKTLNKIHNSLNKNNKHSAIGFLDVFSGTGTISFTEKTQPEYLFRTLLPQCVSIMARLP